MKYKINKLQQGGGFATFTPIVKTSPIGATGSQQSNKKESDESESIIDKKLYEKLITDGGLVNDVNAFVDKLTSLSSHPMAFMNPQNISSALESIKDLNRINRNKKLWEETQDQAKALGGLGEVAVGKQGEIFVRDEDSFKAISLTEFSKNRNKYNPLTVAELLRAREFDPSLVNNDSIFQVGESAHGINNILSKIRTSIDVIKEDKNRTETHYTKNDLQKQLNSLGLIKEPNEQEKNAIAEYAKELLELQNSPGEQIKVLKDTSSKRRYRDIAYRYVVSSLSQEERNKLKAISTINGISVNSLIEDSLILGLSGESNTYEVTPEEPSEGVSGKMTDKSNEELFFSGALSSGKRFEWNDPDTGKVMSMPITGEITWMNEGKPTGLITLNQAAKTSLSQYVYPDDVTFGGKKLGLSDKDKIVQLDNFSRIYMPVNNDGTPNLEKLKELQDAQNDLEKEPNKTPQEINEFYFQRGLPFVQVDNDKTIIENRNLKPYMVGYGYTTSQATAVSNNKNIEKVPSSLEKEVDKALTEVYKAAKVEKPTFLGTMGTDYYKGIIAYPIRETASVIAAANKGNVFSQKTDLSTIKERMEVQSKGNYVPQNTAELLKNK